MLAVPPSLRPIPGSTSPLEVRTVTLLALGFGLVGIDRFLISTLFPVIARDLHLSYSDIGIITGALAVAWGLASLVFGTLSDRIGRRLVLTVSLIVFSVLIGASGLATGLITLVAARFVMGLADGAFTPASIIGTLAVSAPSRIGRNIGIQQMMAPLLGLGLAPLAQPESIDQYRACLGRQLTSERVILAKPESLYLLSLLPLRCSFPFVAGYSFKNKQQPIRRFWLRQNDGLSKVLVCLNKRNYHCSTFFLANGGDWRHAEGRLCLHSGEQRQTILRRSHFSTHGSC